MAVTGDPTYIPVGHIAPFVVDRIDSGSTTASYVCHNAWGAAPSGKVDTSYLWRKLGIMKKGGALATQITYDEAVLIAKAAGIELVDISL